MPTSKPNIVFIIADHQAFYGHDREGEYEFKPPRYEQFASEGIRFDRAYSVCPLCSPARSSMMTGIYPSSHGIIMNTEADGVGNQPDLDSGQQLYSHYLSQAGYRNGYVGKWHCGRERLPIDYGIEGWSLPDYGKIYMSDAYKAYAEERGFGDARALIEYNINYPEWQGQEIVLHDPSPWKFMNGSGILVGPPEAHEEQFVAHLACEKLREFAASDQPFSLVVSLWGPHQPYYPSAEYAAMVDPADIPEYPSFNDDLSGRPLRHFFHREISHLSSQSWPDWSDWQQILARAYAQGLQTDAAVGDVLDTLDELELTDNTIVIWLADHGDAVAAHGGLWDKSNSFMEEVARVPCAIRLPNRIAPGQRTDALVSNMDATATMLDAAGIAVPAYMHSRSLLPLCDGDSDAQWSDELVCEHLGHGHFFPQRLLMTDRYKYVFSLHDMNELYDLQDDPFELNNLAHQPDYADVVADLRGRLLRHVEASDMRNQRLKRIFLLAMECDR